MIRTLTALTLVIVCASAQAQKAPNFRLLDTRGFSHEMARQSDASGVVLVAWDVKHAQATAATEAIAALVKEFQPASVRFFAIDPAPRGDAAADQARIQTAPAPNEELLKNAQALLGSLGLKKGPAAGPGADTTPVLRDPTQAITRALKFRAPFDALVLGKDLSVLFQGPLASEALRGALQQLAAGQLSAPLPAAPAAGDAIALAAWPATPDYVTAVAPIVQAKCATCHHPGGAAPLTFNSHQKLAGYADMIAEVLLAQRMPPWHADPAYGHFKNNRALTDDEQRTLLAWVDAGAPRGEGDDPLASVTAPPAATWRLGAPDVVVGMGEAHQLPAEGVLEYHVVKIPSGFTEDKWIRGVEVRPGNPKVLHHALIFVEYPTHLKAREPQVGGGTGGYFAGFVPGAEPYFYPESTGKFVPAGATFIFQMHYVTTGKPEEDRTDLGIHLCKEQPLERLETEAASNTMFLIPPRVRDAAVTADDGFWMESKLWGLSPHMHYRGSRFKYTAQYHDGTSEVLLSVPNFNFDWQTMYQFAEPKLMPRRSGLLCEGGFDNSVTNPANPDPNDTVRFGDQTFQEMFIGYYEYSAPVEAWERRLGQRERRMAEMKAEFDAKHPGLSSGPPMTVEQLIGTTWKDDDWVFTFKADNEMVVNSLIKGHWKVEDNRVIIDVAGEHFELDILGQGLFFNGAYPIERVK